MDFSQFRTAPIPSLPRGMISTPTNPFDGISSTDARLLLAGGPVKPLIKELPEIVHQHDVRASFGEAIKVMQRLVLSRFCDRGRHVEIGAGPYNGLNSQLGLSPGVLEGTDASLRMVEGARRMGYPVRHVNASDLDRTEGYGPNSLDSVIGVLTLDSMDIEQRILVIESIYKALKPGGHLVHFLDDGANNHVFENFCDAQGYRVFKSEYDRLTRILVPESRVSDMVAAAEPSLRTLLLSFLNHKSMGEGGQYLANANRIAAYCTQQPGVLRVSPNDVFYLSAWWALHETGFELRHFGLLGMEWDGAADLQLHLFRKSEKDPIPNCFVNEAGDVYADYKKDVPARRMRRICKMHVLVARKPL